MSTLTVYSTDTDEWLEVDVESIIEWMQYVPHPALLRSFVNSLDRRRGRLVEQFDKQRETVRRLTRAWTGSEVQQKQLEQTTQRAHRAAEDLESIDRLLAEAAVLGVTPDRPVGKNVPTAEQVSEVAQWLDSLAERIRG